MNKKEIERTASYNEIVEIELTKNSTYNKFLLDFELGATKEETNHHIETLLRNNKIKRFTTVISPWDIKIKGYPYDIQVNDTVRAETLIMLAGIKETTI